MSFFLLVVFLVGRFVVVDHVSADISSVVLDLFSVVSAVVIVVGLVTAAAFSAWAADLSLVEALLGAEAADGAAFQCSGLS